MTLALLKQANRQTNKQTKKEHHFKILLLQKSFLSNVTCTKQLGDLFYTIHCGTILPLTYSKPPLLTLMLTQTDIQWELLNEVSRIIILYAYVMYVHVY